MKKKQGRVCLITGCNGGIGNATAKLFIEKGYRVIATDLKKPVIEGADCQKLNVTDSKNWSKLISHIEKKYGKLDVLLQIAGTLMPGYCYEVTEKQIDLHLSVNVKGIMLGILYASNLMKNNKIPSDRNYRGHIITIASLAGIAPIGGIGLYSASKFAVRGYSLASAQDLHEMQIKTTVLCPDAVKTSMLDLQKDYKQAALTFSGPRPLTNIEVALCLADIADNKNPPLEILLPSSRGFLARIASFWPGIQQKLSGKLRKKGLKKQKEYKESLPEYG